MNKNVKKMICLGLSVVTLASAASLATGCKPEDKTYTYDPETRPVVFSTDALDGNFNPFFATSATDSTIASMTQIGMLTTDGDGKLAYGADQATVVLDYKLTMYDKDGNETTDASLAQKNDDGTSGRTKYEFIIKNGLKYSDGDDLTIDDVLFNLYVYLDPNYMGSATLYSTDIVGLKKYRAQDAEAEGRDDNLDKRFYTEADTRINAMLDYLDPDVGDTPVETPQILADIETVKTLFVEEAESDWSMAAGSQESFKEDYTFTEDWQIYFFNSGIVKTQYVQGMAQKDENGKYITSLDILDEDTDGDGEFDSNSFTVMMNKVKAGEFADRNEEYSLEYWVDLQGCTEAEAAEYVVKAFAIDQVINANTSSNLALADVIRYWATGSNVREDFAAEARSAYFANQTDKIRHIDGIKASTTTKDFSGNNLGESHDVLSIEIYGVDPKAVWNFAFAVAPMHYYSNAETINDKENNPYGVKFADKDFFDTVLQDPEKNGLPVGAGVYKASNEKGSGKVDKTTFYRNNWVYFERNEHFYTVLGNDTANNAKIKYLRYRVVGSDKIMQALEAKNIDFGAPQATTDNLGIVAQESNKHLASVNYQTNGYGYVGINPKFVPDLEVRQAIMHVMDTGALISNYYSGALAEQIFRPMSKMCKPYYPEHITEEYYTVTWDTDFILDLVAKAGWLPNAEGKLYKNGKALKLTFTIAGESTDHPAYEMFQDAADVLNECGFDVSVTTDITALKKLATGGLAVWAAAWSSTIDPDMYQVYHKDSKATSVKNWGYSTIFADPETYYRENAIITALSELIEEGRATLEESERKDIYEEALELVMQLAVELPTYQRNDLVVYNKEVIDVSTLNPEPSAYAGLYDRLWEVDYL